MAALGNGKIVKSKKRSKERKWDKGLTKQWRDRKGRKEKGNIK